MIYRRITWADREAVERFALRGLRAERLPMHLSRERVRAVIDHFVRSKTDFHLGAFDGDEMVGGIAVTVVPMLFFERSEAHIVMLFATRPGVGFRLLRDAMRWALCQPSIRRVLWSLEDDAPHERMARIAERFGFIKKHAILAAYKE